MNVGAVVIEGLRAAIGVPAAAYALAAVGLNVQFGFTGLLNFGQVGFLLVGAYGTAITASRGLPLPLAFLCGLGAAVVLGLILGLPTLRLRADFLAIVTISVAEILRHLARAQVFEGVTGGSTGIQSFATGFFDTANPIPTGRYGIGDLSFDQRQLWITLVGWLLVAGCVLVVRRLVDAPWGRVVKAVRADQDAPRSLGKNVVVYKVQALVVGGVIGALGGIVLAVDAQDTSPDFWSSDLTFFAFAALIIGGLATKVGPVVGAMLFWFLVQAFDSALRQLVSDGPLASLLDPTDVGPLRFAFVGLALMLVMIFRPQGILGDRDDMRAIDA
jgi:branched-chain amino acid transport system permease protein